MYSADVTTDITVIASSAGNSGAVYVTDDGGLTWYRGANHALPAAC
jgi:photosystem II stability/assembly factor-like uncharacterized protein